MPPKQPALCYANQLAANKQSRDVSLHTYAKLNEEAVTSDAFKDASITRALMDTRHQSFSCSCHSRLLSVSSCLFHADLLFTGRRRPPLLCTRLCHVRFMKAAEQRRHTGRLLNRLRFSRSVTTLPLCAINQMWNSAEHTPTVGGGVRSVEIYILTKPCDSNMQCDKFFTIQGDAKYQVTRGHICLCL